MIGKTYLREGIREHAKASVEQGQRIARALIILICAVFLALTTLSIAGMDPAFATVDYNDGSGYADAFLGDTGWKSDVITDLEPESETNEHGTDLVQDLNDFFYNLGAVILGVAIIFCLFRFATRAVYQMVTQNNDVLSTKNKKADAVSGLWRLIMTAEERGTDKLNDTWFIPMLKETFLFIGIAVCASFIVVLLGFVATFMVEQLGGQASNAGFGTFSLGGVEITTK